MTDFLASMAGLPMSVCNAARQISSMINFDQVEPLTAKSQDLEAYHQAMNSQASLYVTIHM